MSDTEEKKLSLTKAHLIGFKSIKDLSVELKPGLNILIGKNGSGKSNFLEFLKGSLSRRFGNNHLNYNSVSLTYSSPVGPFVVSIDKGTKLQKPTHSRSENESDFLAKVFVENVVIYDSSDIDFLADKDKSRLFQRLVQEITASNFAFKHWDIFNFLARELDPLLIRYSIPETLNFVSNPGLIEISYDDTVPWEILDSLSFLEYAFFDLELSTDMGDFETDEKAKKHILEKFVFQENLIGNLKLFTPISDLRLNESFSVYRTDKNIIIDNLRLDFYVNDSWVPWSYLSDGTKRLFYIVVEISCKNDGLILLEEPEIGVHPAQFHLLMQFLKQEAENKQIIISTHSPKALDILQPDELDRVLIATYDKERGTQIGRMDDEKIEKAKNYMKELFLSDYWVMSDLEEDD